ncbi:MAG: hypothetical protein WCK90_04560 [archaeon]
MIVRKTSEKIKEEILDTLKEAPLSVEQIRKKVESNWSTINNYLDELSKEGKVKEIISADKAKIYQRVFGDTYFDIPITDEERKKFRTLFSMILKKYKDMNKTPNKTQLSKAAVKVINSPESGLSALPTVWYLYGAIPLMIADPSREYPEEFEFEHKQKINNIIEVYITDNHNKKTKQIQKEQHREYNDKLYQLADNFLEITETQKWDKQNVFETLNEFFVACPIDEDFKEVFGFTERFVSTTRKLSYFEELGNNRTGTKILLTFDALWKFIATYKFYHSMKKRIPDKNVLNLYLGNSLAVRKACAEESLSDLYSVYWSKIGEQEIKSSADVLKVKEIMQGWEG